jgi:exopolysaccharide production protein ExoY
MSGDRGFGVSGIVTVGDDDSDVRTHAESVHRLIVRHRARVVMVAGPLGAETMRAVSDVALLHGCRLLAVMPSETVAGHDPVIVWEGERPLVQLAAHRHSTVQYALKRLADIALAGVALVVTSPLFVLIGVGILFDSRGPIFFRHWRVGRHGRGFHCLKFRTMQADAEEMLQRDSALLQLYKENHYKLPDDVDPRVTRFGRFLRRTSLDELPQLFNVLVGEMSIVGPRPVVEEELEHYRGSERLLLSMRPGITGAWAVNGRHHVGYPARSELELGYVRQWSLGGDASILMGTVRAVMDPGSDAPAV